MGGDVVLPPLILRIDQSRRRLRCEAARSTTCFWTDFDPTRGRAQAGRGPALVVSSAAFAANTGLALVCPIASRVRPFPTSVVLPPGFAVSGEILTSHVRSIDTLARPIMFTGQSIPASLAEEVRAKLAALITI